MPFNRRVLAAGVATASLACLPTAGASAEVPSVDAYGGQALVLGKPRPPGSHGGPDRHGPAGPRSTGASGRESSRGESLDRESVSGSNRAPSSAGARQRAAGGKKVAPTNAGGNSAATGARAYARAGRANGGAPSATPAADGETAATATLARETQPVGLSGSDLVLLIAIALSLLASGALVRVLSRRPG
jgi:hypothetical protein